MNLKYNELVKDKDAVLFDLDGTLVDSMWVWKAIDIKYLGSLGHEIPPGLQHEIEGMSFTETAIYFKKRFNIPDDVETIKKYWNEMAYEQYTSQVTLKNGVYEFVKKLHEDNIKLGIASSNSNELIEGVLKRWDMLKFFDCITTSCEAGAGKPAPDIYLLAAKKLNVTPSRCLVFEDIPMGLTAGNRAGMTTCAVEDNYSADVRDEKIRLSKYYIKDYYDIEF